MKNRILVVAAAPPAFCCLQGGTQTDGSLCVHDETDLSWPCSLGQQPWWWCMKGRAEAPAVWKKEHDGFRPQCRSSGKAGMFSSRRSSVFLKPFFIFSVRNKSILSTYLKCEMLFSHKFSRYIQLIWKENRFLFCFFEFSTLKKQPQTNVNWFHQNKIYKAIQTVIFLRLVSFINSNVEYSKYTFNVTSLLLFTHMYIPAWLFLTWLKTFVLYSILISSHVQHPAAPLFSPSLNVCECTDAQMDVPWLGSLAFGMGPPGTGW